MMPAVDFVCVSTERFLVESRFLSFDFENHAVSIWTVIRC